MNNMPPPSPRTTRTRIALLFGVALTLSLLVLMMGAPAWAASGPNGWQQGTVPMPPPDPGGGNNGGGNSGGGNDDSAPAATATPVPPAPQAPLAEGTPITVGVPADEEGIVTAPRLNMRGGPGVTFPVIGRVVLSQTVTIQYRDDAGDWWYTCCATDTITSGWVSALYIRPTSFDPALADEVLPVAAAVPVLATPASDGLRGTVSVARLNLRDQPSTQGAILGKLTQGQVLLVNSRSTDDAWWYVCCVAGSNTSGWVSAALIEPGFARADAAKLLPVFAEVGVVLPTPTPRPGAAPSVSATAQATTTLELAIVQEPEFAMPGTLLTLRYAVTNTGSAPATAVELRNELTSTLSLVGGEAGGGGLLRQSKTPVGSTVVAATWPTLGAGEVVTATIAVFVAADAPVGSLIDNIAAVAAQNAAAQTSGVRVGMPPASLPDFQ